MLPVEIVPGVTAATAAASKLGAPLVSDFAVISLSDLLTPWEKIEREVEGGIMRLTSPSCYITLKVRGGLNR